MRAMATTQKVALVDTTGLTRFVQGDTERNDSLPALLAKGWRVVSVTPFSGTGSENVGSGCVFVVLEQLTP